MGWFSKIKKAAKKAVKKTSRAVRNTVEKATAKTPIAKQIRTLTRVSIKDPKSWSRAAKTIGKAYATYQTGGLSAFSTAAVNYAKKQAKKKVANAFGAASRAVQTGNISRAIKNSPLGSSRKTRAQLSSVSRKSGYRVPTTSTARKVTSTRARATATVPSTARSIQQTIPTASQARSVARRGGGVKRGEMTKQQWKEYTSRPKTFGGLL